MPYYESPINAYINPFYLDVHQDVRAEMEARAGAYGANVRSTNTKSISWPYQKMPWAHITSLYLENGVQKTFRVGFEDAKLSNLNSSDFTNKEGTDGAGKLLLYGEQRNQPKYPLLTGIDISNQGLRGSLLKGKFSFIFFPELTIDGFELETMQRVLFTPGNEVQISFGWSEYAEVPAVNKLEFKGIIFGFNWSFNANLSISAEVDVVSATTIALGFSGDQSVIDTDETDIVKVIGYDTEFKGINLITVIDKDLAVVSASNVINRIINPGDIAYFSKEETPSKLLDYIGIMLPSSQVIESEQIIYNDYTTNEYIFNGNSGSIGPDGTTQQQIEQKGQEFFSFDKLWNKMGGKYFTDPNSQWNVNGGKNRWDIIKNENVIMMTGGVTTESQNKLRENLGANKYDTGGFNEQKYNIQDNITVDITDLNNKTIELPDTPVGKTTQLFLKKPKNLGDGKFTLMSRVEYDAINGGNWNSPSDVYQGFEYWGADLNTKNTGKESDDFAKVAFMPRQVGPAEVEIAVLLEEYKPGTQQKLGDKRITMRIKSNGIPNTREGEFNFGSVKIEKDPKKQQPSVIRPIQIERNPKDGQFSVIKDNEVTIVGSNANAFSISRVENNTRTNRKESADRIWVEFHPKFKGSKTATLRIPYSEYEPNTGIIKTTTLIDIVLKANAVETDAELQVVESEVKSETPDTSKEYESAKQQHDATVQTQLKTLPTDSGATIPGTTSETAATNTTPSTTTTGSIEVATPTPTDTQQTVGDQPTPTIVQDRTFWYVRLGSLVEFANNLIQQFDQTYQDKNIFYSLFTMQAFNNETQYNPIVKSANPIDVYFPDKEMGKYGNIQPFNIDAHQFLRQFGRWDSKANKRTVKKEEDIINIGNILVGTDVIKRIYEVFVETGGKNIALKNITKFFDDILGIISAATGDIYEFTTILFDEPQRLLNAPFSYGITETRQRAILSIEDTNLGSRVTSKDGENTVTPYQLDATVIKPLLKNVTVVSKPSKEMASAAYIAARGGRSLLEDKAGGSGLVNLDTQISLGGYQNIEEYKKQYAITLNDLETNGVSLAQSGWSTAWSETFRGNLIKYKRLAGGMPLELTSDAHWLNKAIYPIEFNFTIDGIHGFKFGDVIKTSLIPKHYNVDWDISFTITKIGHKVTPSTWETTVQTAARLSRDAPGFYGSDNKGRV
jgi:hypothetical protein